MTLEIAVTFARDVVRKYMLPSLPRFGITRRLGGVEGGFPPLNKRRRATMGTARAGPGGVTPNPPRQLVS
jgi:hypothetical protein